MVHPQCKVAFAESRGIADPFLWICCSVCQQPHGKNAISLALGTRWWELLASAVPVRGLDATEILMNQTLAGPIYHASLLEQGLHAEAEAVKRQLQDVERELEQSQGPGMTLGADDPLDHFFRGYEMRSEQAADLDDQERFAESEPIYRAIADEARALLQLPAVDGPEGRMIDSIMQSATRSLGNSLACQASQGRDGALNEGERLLREVLTHHRQVLGPDHFETLETSVVLAQCLCLRGGPQAAQLLRECMPKLRASNHPMLPLGQQLMDLMNGG